MKCQIEVTYRYGGAGGQETESEITGSPTHYSAEYWMYDSRLIRRWNRDPVVKSWMSPYHAYSNNPIAKIDPNGANDDWYTDGNGNLKWFDSQECTVTSCENGTETTWNWVGEKLTPSMFSQYNTYNRWYPEGRRINNYDSYGGWNCSFPQASLYHPAGVGTLSPKDQTKMTHLGNTLYANDNVNVHNFDLIVMSSFLNGNGPENFYFHPEHPVSQTMYNSAIVAQAIRNWRNTNFTAGRGIDELISTQSHFSQSIFDILPAGLRTGTMHNPENLVGGAYLVLVPQKISSTEVQLNIYIHNTVSMTSGVVVGKETQFSAPRPYNTATDSRGSQPFTNVGTLFHLTVTIGGFK